MNDRNLLKIHGEGAKKTFVESFSVEGFYEKLDTVF